MEIRYKLTPEGSTKSAWDFCSLSRQISPFANMGISRTEFIKLICKMFIDFSSCDQTEFISKEDDKYYRGILFKKNSQTFLFEEERHKISDQLMHADKLATIGQISAGVAHELNEPLTIIQGFAQLIRKNPVLPEQIEKDIGKIINAAIYGREIIRKLLIFARQMPTKKPGST